MAIEKNTANQKLVVVAVDGDGNFLAGDSANITCTLSKDHGSYTALGDTNPTENTAGRYTFDLTTAETNADHLHFIPVSSTADVSVAVDNNANGATSRENFIESIITELNTDIGDTSINGSISDQVDSIKQEINSGTYGLSAINTNIITVDTVVDAVNVLLTNGTHGLAALDTELGAINTNIDNRAQSLEGRHDTNDANVLGISDEVEDSSHGLSAIKTAVDGVSGGGTTTAEDIDERLTFRFPRNGSGTTSNNRIKVNTGFDGTIAFDLSGVLEDEDTLSSVTSMTATATTGTITFSNLRLHTNKRKVLADTTAISTADTYTISVTVVTATSITAVYKGVLVAS